MIGSGVKGSKGSDKVWNVSFMFFKSGPALLKLCYRLCAAAHSWSDLRFGRISLRLSLCNRSNSTKITPNTKYYSAHNLSIFVHCSNSYFLFFLNQLSQFWTWKFRSGWFEGFFQTPTCYYLLLLMITSITIAKGFWIVSHQCFGYTSGRYLLWTLFVIFSIRTHVQLIFSVYSLPFV